MNAADATQVLLVGKPNSGKTLLFNRLTGLRQKVANFPGVTVEVKRGHIEQFELVDLPGVYSLTAISADEAIAIKQFRDAIAARTCRAVLCVLDSTRLERSLVLGLEVAAAARAARVSCVFALNMIDELRIAKQAIDVKGLSDALGAPVFAISARTREGLSVLRQYLLAQPLAVVTPNVAGDATAESSGATSGEADYPAQARALAQRFAPAAEALLERQLRVDSWVLHPALGFVGFLIAMGVLFQAVFTWAAPLMDATSGLVEAAGALAASWMPTPASKGFVQDGLLGGISAVVVFVPQIFLLTFLIGLLEDSGYLARAAMLCHRPLSRVGLSGKSFVPLLSGHACAIPAIMAARSIESPRARWLTWMAIPLMSCSARLPVYGVLIAAIVPDTTFLGGIVGLQGLTLLALYVLGIASGLVVAAVANKATPTTKRRALPFVLEMPPYRFPHLRPLLLRSAHAAKAFVTRAGGTIFVVSLVVWILGFFPHGEGQLETSFLASIGRWLSPLFAPLGVDWKFSVAILTSFLAREVFVGTLGVLFGLADAGDNEADMVTRLQAAGLPLASGAALLVFFALSLQCVSTLAVLRKESGSRSMPLAVMTVYTIGAYIAAALVRLIVLTASGA